MKKIYQKPTMEVVELPARTALLAGSGEELPYELNPLNDILPGFAE